MPVAMKETRPKGEDDEEGVPPSVIREVCFLKQISGHPNIVRLQDVLYHESSKMTLVLEHLPYDLSDVITKKPTFCNTYARKWVHQILEAVSYCHARKLLHRDLKPQNLLLDNEHNIKVADFGLARTFSIANRPYTEDAVTLWYRSPEILLGDSEYSLAVDVWSVGCIMGEILLKKPLFPGSNEIDQLQRIFRSQGTPTEEIWPGVSQLPNFPPFQAEALPLIPLRESHVGESLSYEDDENALDLLSLFLIYHPKTRISAKRALKHSWFQPLSPNDRRSLVSSSPSTFSSSITSSVSSSISSSVASSISSSMSSSVASSFTSSVASSMSSSISTSSSFSSSSSSSTSSCYLSDSSDAEME